MGNYEYLGMFFIVVLPVAGALLALIVPVINLNKVITKLDVSLKMLVKEKDEFKDELKDHEHRLEDHEKRIYHIEHNRGDRE